MVDSLRFDNRVVIITGAGSGLGKAYALEFGKRGAKVVANDLGVSRSGEGHSSRVADIIVQEIQKLGGTAVANYDSVENGDRIVKTAIDSFGRVDIVINNAGILRDASILKMKDADWDIIMSVHLKGAFTVNKAAWKYMKQQKYGRIINTSSGSGIYGNFGQANYGAAKMGLHGMTLSLAKEGEKNNIRINSIAPVAASRMTEDLLAPEILNIVTPEKIVPLVVYLCHESCNDTGGLYEACGGLVTRVRWQRSPGTFFTGQFSAEDVQARWREINSFENNKLGNPDYPASTTDTLKKVLALIQETARPKL